MKRSTERILTTHCGSLPRPPALLDLMKARLQGDGVDPEVYAGRLRQAVADSVRLQVEHGLDVVTDGEQSKTGFFSYVYERLGGFEARPGEPVTSFSAEVKAFPEYYQEYFARAMMGGAVARPVPLVCVGPVTYRGRQTIQDDIDNLMAALEGAEFEEVFMPAVSPSGPGNLAPSPDAANEYYPTYEEYLFAVADALHEEYQAIVDAGFLIQVDDPFLTDLFGDPSLSRVEAQARAELYVEATNRALRGIAAEKVRFHTCYGVNEGPRVHDAGLNDVIAAVLRINACGLSFEGANARHEHEYHVWETVRLPDDKVLIPGVITHTSNIVEHPELIAERLARYARLVGRENVLASADCGFSSQATYRPEVHPTVMWAKFDAVREGADLATAELWP